jgi:hypothetical protein
LRDSGAYSAELVIHTPRADPIADVEVASGSLRDRDPTVVVATAVEADYSTAGPREITVKDILRNKWVRITILVTLFVITLIAVGVVLGVRDTEEDNNDDIDGNDNNDRP